jgi:hypothetical protein
MYPFHSDGKSTVIQHIDLPCQAEMQPLFDKFHLEPGGLQESDGPPKPQALVSLYN